MTRMERKAITTLAAGLIVGAVAWVMDMMGWWG